MTKEMTVIERARQALQAAVRVEQVTPIIYTAEALQDLARKALNRDMECWAAELKIRAERKLGTILADTLPHKGGRPKKTVLSEDRFLPESLAACFIRRRLRFPSVLFWISTQSPAVFAATFEDIGTTYLRWRGGDES